EPTDIPRAGPGALPAADGRDPLGPGADAADVGRGRRSAAFVPDRACRGHEREGLRSGDRGERPAGGWETDRAVHLTSPLHVPGTDPGWWGAAERSRDRAGRGAAVADLRGRGADLLRGDDGAGPARVRRSGRRG